VPKSLGCKTAKAPAGLHNILYFFCLLFNEDKIIFAVASVPEAKKTFFALKLNNLPFSSEESSMH